MSTTRAVNLGLSTKDLDASTTSSRRDRQALAVARRASAIARLEYATPIAQLEPRHDFEDAESRES